MEPLLEAIYSTCSNTSSIVAAFPAFIGRGSVGTPEFPVALYPDLAPEGAPLPFLVQTVIAAPTEYRYGGPRQSDPLIQFTAYSASGRTSVMQLVKTFTDAFDELIMTLSSGHQTNVFRTGEPIPRRDPDKDSSGQIVWSATVSYQFSTSPR